MLKCQHNIFKQIKKSCIFYIIWTIQWGRIKKTIFNYHDAILLVATVLQELHLCRK